MGNSKNTLVIGDEQYCANALRQDLEKDIAYLKDCIAHYRQETIDYGSTSRGTYQDMLNDRESLLDWLKTRVDLSE